MPEAPLVQTIAGTVRGEWAGGSARFRGIPYAEPPFGERRFLPPEPRRPWTGVLDATQFGPTPQRKALAEITTIPEPSIPGEDILTLNVFTPRPTPSEEGLPVMVWIHGGGYVAGSPASPWYDGRSFSRDGVVTVTIGYRLGFDGFGWIPDAPNNRGVLDWLLALTWVQENIAQFGGDPTRVTIAGQSAGGGAIMTLLTLPAATGLFHRAISVSGVPADVSLADAKTLTAQVAERLGVPATREGFAGVPEADLIAAQGFGMDPPESTEPEEILASLGGFDGHLGLGPVVDGELIPGTVEDGLAAGRGSTIPLLVGATHDEFGGAVAALGAVADIDAVTALRHMGVEAELATGYAASVDGLGTAGVVAQYITDVMFRQRIIDWIRLRSDAPTWVYDFTWKSAASGLAEHCVDVPFIFDVLDAPDCVRVLGDAPPAALADGVHGSYVQMIIEGDPGWARDEVHVYDVAPADGDTYRSARYLAGASGR